jgi:macrodomain Ter protein organizer (MatP/YcbG family)
MQILQAKKKKKKYYQKNQNHIKKNSIDVRFSLRILL